MLDDILGTSIALFLVSEKEFEERANVHPA